MISEHVIKRRTVSATGNITIGRGADSTTGRPQLGAVYDNTGATGSVTYTLPAGQKDDLLFFDVVAAQAMVIYGGTAGVFTLSGTSGSAGQSLRNSGTAGESLEIICVAANTWRVRNPIGSHWSVS
jgi:hypothetical protein